MENNPIFISSSDSYSDLWPIFFHLFKKFWPEYNGIIYLNTEDKEFHYNGLNIHCTKVGKLNSFGKTFRAGLDKINSPYVLLIMIDYFFMGEVNDQLLKKYFHYFKNNNLDSLCLVKQPFDKSESLNYEGLRLVLPPSKDMFSYQTAFWKVEKLYDMALPHESPWLSEWYGTLRANKMRLKLAYTDIIVIPYLPEGALHKGKWVEQMINFLNDENYQVDFSERGKFVEIPISLKLKIKERIQTFIPRFLSNIDLIKRKYL